VTRRVTDASGVTAFRSAADDFCDLIDRRRQLERGLFFKGLERSLAALVAAAVALPDVDNLGSRRNDDLGEYFALKTSLAEFFDHFDVVSEVYDPYDRAPQPITYTLSDATANVYSQIKPGLRDWADASASERRRLTWDWWFGFHVSWGHDAIDVIRAVHALSRHRLGYWDADWSGTVDEIPE
jgi:hypothetical protein